MADIKETAPFNFDELYNGVKTKFDEKGYDTAEGSNVSQLITAMSYLTSMLNVNTAGNINETLLPLTTRRDNALQNARALGYEIQHKKSFKYNLTIRLGEGTNIIPKYTEFTYGTKKYYYMGDQLTIENNNLNDGINDSIDITVIEGNLFKYIDNPNELSVTTTNVADDSKQNLSLTLKFLMDANLVLEKYTEFVIDGQTYYYLDSQIEKLGASAGDTFKITVSKVVLPKYVTTIKNINEYSVNGNPILTVDSFISTTIPQYFIDVPYIDVEENGIEMFVTSFNENNEVNVKEPYTQADRFLIETDFSIGKQYMRLDNIENRTPRLYFKLAGVGAGLRVGTIVNMNVLTTSGTDGAIYDITDVLQLKYTLSNNMSVSKISLLSDGQDEETIQSIIDNAAKFNNSANRIVLKTDYETFCNRQTSIKNSKVWGGDDEVPKSPGHIWFSFMPSTYPRNFTSNANNDNYILDNSNNVSWDYTLDVEDPVEFDALNTMYENNQIFYSSHYLEDTEIRSNTYNSDQQLINLGVWDKLDNYKIPTMEFHNRHPIFVDYEYDISVLKYNIDDLVPEVNSNVFNAIDTYFNGDDYFTGYNDYLKMEEFGSEYFQSSLERRIDYVLTDASGFNINTSTKIQLTAKNISTENYSTDLRDIFIPLSVPLENYFDENGFLIIDNMPNIDTTNFVSFGLPNETIKSLYVDWPQEDTTQQVDLTNLPLTHINNEAIVAPIRMTDNTSYTITDANIVSTFNSGNKSYITFDKSLVVPDDPTGLDNADVTDYTFDNVEIRYNGTTMEYGVDWDYQSDISSIILLHGNVITSLSLNDEFTITSNVLCGHYTIYNSYKKYIIIQLYINANQYFESPQNILDDINGVVNSTFGTNVNVSGVSNLTTPKSYLTSSVNCNLYFTTNDGYYLTTDGYATADESMMNPNATIVKHVSPASYTSSPLLMEYFRVNRYLNLTYPSNNMSFSRNVIPRLQRVTFN